MPEYLAPGVYIEEVSFRPKSIEGVSTSTTAFVGPTRKGPLTGTPEVITSFGEFARIYGGLANLSFANGNPNYMAHAVRSFFDNGGSRLYLGRTFIPSENPASDGVARSNPVVNNADGVARFIARMPGSGLNGAVRAFEKLTPATPRTMGLAPEGSLLRVGGDDLARPALVQGGAPTFALNDGDRLTLTLNTGPAGITFTGGSAEARGSDDLAADPLPVPADTVLEVTVGGVGQRIPLDMGDTVLADLVGRINTQLRHGYARLDGMRLVIGSDVRGTGAAVSVEANATLGFAARTAASGTGNVADLENGTVAEIDQLLQAAGIGVRATLPPSTGQLRLSSTETGVAATLQVDDTPARVALGLPMDEAQGADGVDPQYYVKDGGSWIGGADRSTALDLTSDFSAVRVTMNLEARDADGHSILYDDLGFSPAHPRYAGLVLSQEPSRRTDALENPYYLHIDSGIHPFDLREGIFDTQSENTIVLEGGNDGVAPVAATNIAGAISYEGALELLEDIEDISIIAAPGHSALSATQYAASQQSLISHAERMRYRVAVLDTPPNNSLAEARAARSFIDTTYAAIYYPWVVVANPLARPGNDQIPKEIALPSSGFVTGIYARNDIRRGVWKAPANEVVRGALRFEREINHRQQEVLNPEGINCLRYFYGRGNRVWGARTASSDPEWKYVNVRRYFIYLERSIDRSTQWTVFEPNGERLWSNIRETVSAFLYNEWRSRALLGASPEEAYFVRCDRSVMTQNDLDNGRLICEIGVAVLKPAEFVIFRIGQKTADARA